MYEVFYNDLITEVAAYIHVHITVARTIPTYVHVIACTRDQNIQFTKHSVAHHVHTYVHVYSYSAGHSVLYSKINA